MKHYMITMPRNENQNALKLIRYINTHDVKKWIIGSETGRSGYEHWQCRIAVSDDHFYEFETRQVWDTHTVPAQIVEKKIGTGWINVNIPEAHVEECSDTWDYETKEGRYIASWDSPDVIRQRFGKPRWYQEAIIQRLRATNDREIVVWYDPKGNAGKSWLIGHLYETGQAYFTECTLSSVQAMVQDIANDAGKDRKAGRPPREFVIIDMPRSWKWSDQLYTAIEHIKDGLIKDPRYQSAPVNIRGVKVLVLTNHMPDVKKLSDDRWIIENTPML